MSILIVLFGLLSDCLLSVLVGIIGSHRRIGFGWAFLISLIFTPLVGLIVALLTDPLPGGGQRWGCVGTVHSGAVVLRRVPAAGADGRGHAAGPVKTGTEMSIPLHQTARRFDSGIFLKEGSSTSEEEPVGYAHRDDYGD